MDKRKKQVWSGRLDVDKVIAKVLARVATCPHSNMVDCNRCVARWIRQATPPR